MKLNDRELAAVLCGLRLFQEWLKGKTPTHEGLWCIATNDRTQTTLSHEEVEDLCGRLNTGETGVACAWCRKDLRPGEIHTGPPSHGICLPCAQAQIEGYKKALAAVANAQQK